MSIALLNANTHTITNIMDKVNEIITVAVGNTGAFYSPSNDGTGSRS